MIRWIISGFLLILTLQACYHAAPETSFNMALVMPADSLVLLLADIHLADGIINTVKDKGKSVKPLATEYFEAILEKHSISRVVFEESMRYYAYHSEELNDIYEKVITELSMKESLSIPDTTEKTPDE